MPPAAAGENSRHPSPRDHGEGSLNLANGLRQKLRKRAVSPLNYASDVSPLQKLPARRRGILAARRVAAIVIARPVLVVVGFNALVIHQVMNQGLQFLDLALEAILAH